MTSDASKLSAIRTEGLSKRYGDIPALVGLDLEVPPCEVVGYLGPNGAGKTTTIRLLLSLILPTGSRRSSGLTASVRRSRPTGKSS